MQSVDDSLTSPAMHDIFTLKSSSPIFVDTFCHFINSNVAGFMIIDQD